MFHLIYSLMLFVFLGAGCSVLTPIPEQFEHEAIDWEHLSTVNNEQINPLFSKVAMTNSSLSETHSREIPPVTAERKNFVYKSPVIDFLPAGGEPIDMRFYRVPLHIFNRVMMRLTGKNIVVDHTVGEKYITVNLSAVPWREAFQIAMRTHGLQARYHNSVIVILPDDQKDEPIMDSQLHASHTELFSLLYAEPDHIREIIEPLFSEKDNKPSFSIDKRTRALLVQGNAEQIKLISALVEQIDVPIKQVRIEAFIVEAGDDFERSFGTRLGINRLGTGESLQIAGVTGRAPTADGKLSLGGDNNLAVDLPLTAPNAGIGFLLDSARLKVELTALENEGKSRIVSNPKIFTLDNREAVIFQGDEVPYFTVSENGTQTQFKEAGIRLAVTPSIVGNNNLLLDISVNKDTVDTRLANPPITRRHVATKLKIPDGAMVVIGGIYFNTKVDTLERVPILGSIPIAGALFRRSQKARDIKELLVFISPSIIRAN